MGASTLVIPEKNNAAEGYEEPIDVVNDGLAGGGFYPQTSSPGDLSVGIERDASGSLVFKSGQHPFNLRAINELLEIEPNGVGITYTPTFTSGKITQEKWATTAGALDVKTIDYTYSGNKVTQEVRKVFAANGSTIVAQTTIAYSYSGNDISSYTITRDV